MNRTNNIKIIYKWKKENVQYIIINDSTYVADT